jgi:hypothetical protein
MRWQPWRHACRQKSEAVSFFEKTKKTFVDCGHPELRNFGAESTSHHMMWLAAKLRQSSAELAHLNHSPDAISKSFLLLFFKKEVLSSSTLFPAWPAISSIARSPPFCPLPPLLPL